MKNQKNHYVLLSSIFVLFYLSTQAQEVRTLGVKINVTDMQKAKAFYCQQLGFDIASELTDNWVTLKSGDNNKLILHKVPLLLPEGDQETKASLTFQVNHIDSTIKTLKMKGIDFGNEQKRKEGVGYAIYVKDPFQKRISFMHQTVGNVPNFDEPRIYNYGYLIPDMDVAISFYSGILGFAERSKNYLPLDMPLGHSDKTFGFMLHYRPGIEPTRFNISDNEHVVVLFQTKNLDQLISTLREKNVQFIESTPAKSPLGRYISFYDPFGYISEIYEVK